MGKSMEELRKSAKRSKWGLSPKKTKTELNIKGCVPIKSLPLTAKQHIKGGLSKMRSRPIKRKKAKFGHSIMKNTWG